MDRPISVAGNYSGVLWVEAGRGAEVAFADSHGIR
jgi:hypothetical protein